MSGIETGRRILERESARILKEWRSPRRWIPANRASAIIEATRIEINPDGTRRMSE